MEFLSDIFEDYYQARIIEIILENYREEITSKDIMEMADTSQGSTYKYIKKLSKKGLLKKTRKIGKTQFYRINTDNIYIKGFLLFEHILVKHGLEEKIKKMPKKIIEKEPEKYEKSASSYSSEKYDRYLLKEESTKEPPIISCSVNKGETKKWQELKRR